jgi:hypothetical protein
MTDLDDIADQNSFYFNRHLVQERGYPPPNSTSSSSMVSPSLRSNEKFFEWAAGDELRWAGV